MAVALDASPLVLEQRAAHLVQVVGDDGVQARACAAPVAHGDDGDPVPGLLGGELVAGELGRQLAQFRWRAGHANHGVPAGTMICLVSMYGLETVSKVRISTLGIRQLLYAP